MSTTFYKVPKKSKLPTFKVLKDNSDQKVSFERKLIESFKKPDISKVNMNFLKYWEISNPEIEKLYGLKRQALKVKNQILVDNFGYLYLKSESDLKNIVKLGKIRIGNIPDSKLGVGRMGVSLSQFSDIFHPDERKHPLPTEGILLIIKYLKSKVNYVEFNNTPLEPQPSFDCHLVRNLINFDANTMTNKAFHFTQVFLYEYTEDIDIVEYPTQLLIVGAVQFCWKGKYIFKNLSDPQNIDLKSTKKRPLADISKSDDPISSKQKCVSIISKLTKLNSDNSLLTVMHGNISIKNESSTAININVMLMTKFKEPLSMNFLLSPDWELSEIIPNQTFIDFFRHKDENHIISMLKLSIEDVNCIPSNFYDTKAIPNEDPLKYAVYVKITASTFANKKSMDKLIANFYKSKAVGRIDTPIFQKFLFFIFPSGDISNQLGIPIDDTTCLHGLLLFYRHPEIESANMSVIEENIFTTLTKKYYSDCKTTPKSIIKLEKLLQIKFDRHSLIQDENSKVMLKSKFDDMDSEIPMRIPTKLPNIINNHFTIDITDDDEITNKSVQASLYMDQNPVTCENNNVSPNLSRLATSEQQKKPDLSTRVPFGQFRLVSRTRYDQSNQPQPKEGAHPGRCICIASLQLMTDYEYVSIYRG